MPGAFDFRDMLRALAGQTAMFEALLLLASALHKIFDWRHLRNVTRHFVGLPATLAPGALAVAVLVELAAGAALMSPTTRSEAAFAATLLWAAYLALIVRALIDGRRDADCGCSLRAAHRPLGSYHVVRNGVLLVLAAFVAAASNSSDGAVAVAASTTQILPACALLASYLALDQVMALQPLGRGEVS